MMNPLSARIAERLLPAQRRDTLVCAQLKAYVQFGMHIWDKGPRTILSVLLSSTADRFYISQLAQRSGFARNTVCSILDRLEEAGIVVREEESFAYDSPFRAPRVYYSLDPRSFHHVRIQGPST
jgi:DNA-binding transcriptional ArsR family regulator